VGLIVLAVEAASPAEKGGLLLGDVLVALDGHPVRHVGDLYGAQDEERIGVETTARIVRAGQLAEAKIRIGSKG
jgi:S1-C subfamily serine protease